MRNYLVFDAGGTFIKYALMDENAQILEKDKVSTPYFEDHGKEDFYRVLEKWWRSTGSRSGESP